MKMSFIDAAGVLSRICDRIDLGDEIDAALQSEFTEALDDIAFAVDRRKFVYAEVESKIELAKKYRDKIKQDIKKFETIKERLIDSTKAVIEMNPSIPFKDSLGKALKVLPNPSPKLVITKSVPSEYSKVVLEPNKELIKEALLRNDSDLDIDFAYLEYGTQLRGMK